MDDKGLEVDDLFGDGGVIDGDVPMSLPVHTIPLEGLAQHLDNLHRSTAEQKVLAWSKQGCLAAVSADHSSVSLQCLELSPTEREWRLSEARFINLNSPGEARHSIVQLAWNSTGVELAVADAGGRVTVLSMSVMALNDAKVSRPASLDREDELSQAIAIHWFSNERQLSVTFPSAVKSPNGWSYKPAKRVHPGPIWLQAFAVVSPKGMLTVHYRKFDGWSSVTAELRSLEASGNLLTHATIAPTKGNAVLIVTQNSKSQLFIYSATIEFPDMKKDPQMKTSARIHLENVQAPTPFGDATSHDASNGDSMLYESSSHLLSHLEIIPTSDIEGATQTPPTILAFYTPRLNAMGLLSEGQIAFTTVRRWQYLTVETEVHAIFSSLQPKATPGATPKSTQAQRLGDVHLDQVVIFVQKVHGSDHLALGGADGSVAFYDSESLTLVYLTDDLLEMTSLCQTGFAFPLASGGLKPALSPNGCVLSHMDADGKIYLTHLENPGVLTTSLPDPALTEASVTSLVLTIARTSMANTFTSSNDLMLLIAKVLDDDLFSQLIQSILKSLLSDREFYPQKDTPSLFANNVLPRLFGLISWHGSDPKTGQRSVPSVFCSQALAVRSSMTVAMGLFRCINAHGGADFQDPELCDVSRSNIRWILELCKSIVDDIFELIDQVPSFNPPQNESSINISKLLLLSKWPRKWLMNIPSLFRIVSKSQELDSKISDKIRPALAPLAKVIDECSLRMEPLAHLLSDADKIVGRFYEEAGFTDTQRGDNERFIIAHGQVPAVMEESVLSRLREALTPERRANLARLSLYLEDYSWLGIRDDPATKAFQKKYVMDVSRKTVLSRKGLGRLRRCNRCRSVSADIVWLRQPMSQLAQQLMCRCVCDEMFAIVSSVDA